MVPLPDGVEAKVLRAQHHLHLIDAVVSLYIESRPYVIEAEFQDNPKPWPGLEHLPISPGWVGVARLRTPPPRDLPVMIGDFVQNLRNSLDHLARGLVVSNGGQPEDEGRGKTAFPLHNTNQNKPVRIVARSGGAAPGALTVLEGLQPHTRQPYQSHPLFVLNDLSNIDKHRTLHIPAIATGDGMIFSLINWDIKKAFVQPHIESFNLERFQNGAVVSVMPAPWPRDAKVNVDPQFSVVPSVITLEVVGPETYPVISLVARLESLLRFVREEAIRPFKPFFAGDWPGIF